MRIFTRIVTAALAAVAALAFVQEPASAKGGGGGGGGTTLEGGVIYFSLHTSTSRTDWKMNTDGTGKTALPDGVGGDPSYVKHGDERWFLRVEEVDGWFGTPDASDKCAELFAVNELGTKKVQLTNLVAAGVVPDHTGTNMWLEQCRWVGPANDAEISFLGYVVGTTSNTQWGLYVVDVNWTDVLDGGTYTAPTQMTLHSQLGTFRAGGPGGVSYRGWYQNISYAWSPDGTKVAYGRWPNGNAGATDLWIRDVTTGADTQIRTATFPGDWSSQNTILCRDGAGTTVFSIAPDGGSYVQVVSPPRRNSWVNYGSPLWSPTANFVLYTYHDFGSSDASKRFQDIHRVSAQGTGDTNLTGTVGGYAYPSGWRQ